MKYLFVSDVHLGSGASSAENTELEGRFIKWLDNAHRDRATIFLLGDIFDFWFEYKNTIPTTHSAVLGKLKQMSSDGIEIHFFKGNHDMWLRDYLQKEIGLIIHDQSEILTIAGRKIMIGHGHDLCFKSTFLTRMLWILFHSKFLYNLASLIIRPNLMMKIGNKWSQSSRKNKDISHTFRGEDEFITSYINSSLEDYRSQGVSEFIFGHFHCPTIFRLKDGIAKIIILGEWSNIGKYGEIIDDSEIFLKSENLLK